MFSPPNQKHVPLNNVSLSTSTSHKDLGVILSSNLSWSPHITSILQKAYRSLGLLKRAIPYESPTDLKRSLYLLLVRSHVLYCSPIWRPHLIKDSKALETLQRRATKYILSSSIDYKSRLIVLKLFPITLWLEIQDVLLLIKLIQNPPNNFQLDDYIIFSTNSTRSSTHNRIKSSNIIVPRLKPVLQCSHTHSPYCLILQPNRPQCLSCCLTCFGWS